MFRLSRLSVEVSVELGQRDFLFDFVSVNTPKEYQKAQLMLV